MNKKCFRNGIRPSSFKQILKKFIFYKKIIKKIFPKKSIFFKYENQLSYMPKDLCSRFANPSCTCT